MNIAVTNLQHKIPIPVSKIRTSAQQIAQKLKLKFLDLSIVFVGPQRMKTINRTYLKHDYVTDVITFHDGEIVVCPSMAVRNAKQYGNSANQEILLCVVHGLLHLAGYNDHTPKDILVMRSKEQQIMKSLSFPRKRESRALDSRPAKQEHSGMTMIL